MEFRGFDSSMILIIRGDILMSTGDFPENLSQAILVGIMLVGRLGVMPPRPRASLRLISMCWHCLLTSFAIIHMHMRSSPGWLETRLAQITLDYLKLVAEVCFVFQGKGRAACFLTTCIDVLPVSVKKHSSGEEYY